MEEFNNLKRVAVNELRKLDSQYANKNEFAEADAKKYDYLMHGLKCHLTACAMMEAEEYNNENYSGENNSSMNSSGRRGRADNGQYTSRAMNNSARQSYDDGYSRGYYDAQQNMSGHWPQPPYPPRNW